MCDQHHICITSRADSIWVQWSAFNKSELIGIITLMPHEHHRVLYNGNLTIHLTACPCYYQRKKSKLCITGPW